MTNRIIILVNNKKNKNNEKKRNKILGYIQVWYDEIPLKRGPTFNNQQYKSKE